LQHCFFQADDDVDDDVEDKRKEALKRPADQVTKTKALRDRHTVTVATRSLDDVALVDADKICVKTLIDADKNCVKPNDSCDKNFAALVEKYSANERVTMEGKFLNARSVFEATTANNAIPTKSQSFRP
jgi:ssDNA-binding replication factor A large subunit